MRFKLNVMKIVVLDGYGINPGDLSWKALEELGEVVVYPRTAAADVVSRLGDAQVALTNKVLIGEAEMQQLPQLRYIGVLATGYNVVDTAAARARGIIVTNIPAYSTHSVVQMTFAHILNITNRVGYYARENRAGRWSASEDFCYRDFPMFELAGKTLGIVGLGSIGMRVAYAALGIGMDVYATTSKNPADLPEGIRKTTFEGLLGTSDIITLHCPLCEDTREIINARTIAMMKRGTIVINTGRGALVNENDVADALRSGQLGAFGADVMCQEPPAADNPLLSAPNAFITPHIAWATTEARTRLIDIAAGNIRAFAEGSPINVVN